MKTLGVLAALALVAGCAAANVQEQVRMPDGKVLTSRASFVRVLTPTALSRGSDGSMSYTSDPDSQAAINMLQLGATIATNGIAARRARRPSSQDEVPELMPVPGAPAVLVPGQPDDESEPDDLPPPE